MATHVRRHRLTGTQLSKMADDVQRGETNTVGSKRYLLDSSEHTNAFWKAVGVGDVAEVQKVLDGGWVEEIDCVVAGGELKDDVGVDLEGYWGRSALMVASGRGHCDLVRFLLEKGAKVDFQDCYGKSALMLASKCGQCEVARLLLDRGADVGLKDCSNGKSALMIASECGQCEVVKLLLDAGAQVDLQDKVGRTAIVLASEHGHGKVGMLLLERMAPVDTATLSTIMVTVMVEWKSLLRECLEPEFYFFEYIEDLIKSASVIEYHQEILWLACLCGNFKLCQAFVAKCHWVVLTPLWGKALFLACGSGHCEIVALLLEKGFPQDLVHYGEYSALAMACACIGGHCEVVKLLLGRGADVDAAMDSKHFREILDWLCIPSEDVLYMPEFALVAAASNGHTEIVRLLLDKGARVGLHSAITSAIEGGFREVVEIFVESCAEKDLLDSNCYSPLMLAIQYDCYEMAKFLLEKGAQVNLQDNSGISPLMVSLPSMSRWPLSECTVAELLLERGAQIDLQNIDGMSALMLATRYGLLDMTKWLLEKGAQIDLQDKSGRSACYNDCK